MEKHSEDSELKAALKFMASEGQTLIMTFYHYKGEPRRQVAAATTEAAVLDRGHSKTGKQFQYLHGILSSWLRAVAGQGALDATSGWCGTWLLAPLVWLLVCTPLTDSPLLDIGLFPSFQFFPF